MEMNSENGMQQTGAGSAGAPQKKSQGRSGVEELIRLQKKQLGWTRFSAFCVAVMMAAFCFLAVKVNSLIPQATELMTHVDGLTEQVTELAEEISVMADNLNEVTESIKNEGLDEIYGTLENIQRIDIDSLNASIKSLHDVVQPLADFFGLFSGK